MEKKISVLCETIHITMIEDFKRRAFVGIECIEMESNIEHISIMNIV